MPHVELKTAYGDGDYIIAYLTVDGATALSDRISGQQIAYLAGATDENALQDVLGKRWRMMLTKLKDERPELAEEIDAMLERE